MKKFILIAMFIIAAVQTWAQSDTLKFGMREPTFYYWDTNWVDYYMQYTNGNESYGWISCWLNTNTCQPEWARYCYTDSALRVIGVAAALRFYPYNAHVYPDQDPQAHFEEEFLRLYEVDSTTGELVFLAEGEWTKTKSRYTMQTADPYGNPLYYEYMDVYEVYFKTPQIVRDSFYVSATAFNNRCYRDGYPYMVVRYPGIYLTCFDPNEPNHFDFGPIPNHLRRKLHVWDGTCNVDLYNLATDTLWHVFHRGNSPLAAAHQDWRLFVPFFPIIDTGWHGGAVNPDECLAPTGLNAMYVNNEVAVFSWNGGYAHQWQLAVAPDGGEPGSGIVYNCTTDIQSVSGLDTARWYNAWVRSICDNDSVSEWSDSIRFYVPSTNTGTIGVGQPIDALTHVMPNPASGQVSVISSYRIGSIDIYSLSGSRVMTLNPDANTCTADISSLPAGSYLMRIHTTNGVANKRLVVK